MKYSPYGQVKQVSWSPAGDSPLAIWQNITVAGIFVYEPSNDTVVTKMSAEKPNQQNLTHARIIHFLKRGLQDIYKKDNIINNKFFSLKLLICRHFFIQSCSFLLLLVAAAGGVVDPKQEQQIRRQAQFLQLPRPHLQQQLQRWWLVFFKII